MRKYVRKGRNLNSDIAFLGKHHSAKTRKNIGLANTGKKRSEKAKIRLSLSHKGEKHWNWKGGITPLTTKIRTSDKSNQWRQQVFLRDNFTCQKCGDNTGGNLHAHHKKAFSRLIEEVKKYLPLLPLYEAAMLYTPLWDIDNGKTLCKKCHHKKSKGRPKKGGFYENY